MHGGPTNEKVLEHQRNPRTTQGVAAGMLDTDDLPHRAGPRVSGKRVQHTRLLPDRHQRYRRAGSLRVRRRMDAHHSAYSIRQRGTLAHAIHNRAARYNTQTRHHHHRMLLRNEHDARLRGISAEAQRGFRGLCRHDFPTVSLVGSVVSEATQADKHAH